MWSELKSFLTHELTVNQPVNLWWRISIELHHHIIECTTMFWQKQHRCRSHTMYTAPQRPAMDYSQKLGCYTAGSPEGSSCCF